MLVASEKNQYRKSSCNSPLFELFFSRETVKIQFHYSNGSK